MRWVVKNQSWTRKRLGYEKDGNERRVRRQNVWRWHCGGRAGEVRALLLLLGDKNELVVSNWSRVFECATEAPLKDYVLLMARKGMSVVVRSVQR